MAKRTERDNTRTSINLFPVLVLVLVLVLVVLLPDSRHASARDGVAHTLCGA
jgi:hypothetical protein